MPRACMSALTDGLSLSPKVVFNMFSEMFFSQCITSKTCRTGSSCSNFMCVQQSLKYLHFHDYPRRKYFAKFYGRNLPRQDLISLDGYKVGAAGESSVHLPLHQWIYTTTTYIPSTPCWILFQSTINADYLHPLYAKN